MVPVNKACFSDRFAWGGKPPERGVKMEKLEYLTKISHRGDRYGGHGGILDLLTWCGKPNTASVTVDEARVFLENPLSVYSEIFPPAKDEE